MTFMPNLNTEADLAEHQLAGLKWTVNHAYNGSAFYKSSLDRAGVNPSQIKNLDDIRPPALHHR
jgi:phenylacetate-CoA ligase